MPDNLANDSMFVTLRRDYPMNIELLRKAWNHGYEQAAFDAALEEIQRLKCEYVNLKYQVSVIQNDA